MSDTNTLTQRLRHLPPDTNKYERTGVATVLEGVDLNALRPFHPIEAPYLHPFLLYDVKGRGVEGDALSSASISLGDDRRLVVGTHVLGLMENGTRREQSVADLNGALRSLKEHFSGLEYEATARRGDGIDVRFRVSVAEQIEGMVMYHFALMQ